MDTRAQMLWELFFKGTIMKKDSCAGIGFRKQDQKLNRQSFSAEIRRSHRVSPNKTLAG